MNISQCMQKVIKYEKLNILSLSIAEFYKVMDKYDFLYEDFVIIMGILLNKSAINKTKHELGLLQNNSKENIITEFAIFAFIFIGEEYNDKLLLRKLKLKLNKSHKKLFIDIVDNLITNCTRTFILTDVLGSDNDRANMYSINAISNIKKGIGFDNFHLTLFAVYQSLELKLKHCIKKYIEFESSASKKHYNFHNLVRLIKLISTSRVTDSEFAKILDELRQDLRYFEKINPGGQAARYESDPDRNYFGAIVNLVVNEKVFLTNYVRALNLLQRLYVRLIEIYRSEKLLESGKINNIIDPTIAALIGIDLTQSKINISERLRNIIDEQIFGNHQELIDLSNQELLNLKFLFRIGFVQYVNQAVELLLKK